MTPLLHPCLSPRPGLRQRESRRDESSTRTYRWSCGSPRVSNRMPQTSSPLLARHRDWQLSAATSLSLILLRSFRLAYRFSFVDVADYVIVIPANYVAALANE